MKEKRKSFGKGFKGFVSLMMATALIGAPFWELQDAEKTEKKLISLVRPVLLPERILLTASP